MGRDAVSHNGHKPAQTKKQACNISFYFQALFPDGLGKILPFAQNRCENRRRCRVETLVLGNSMKFYFLWVWNRLFNALVTLPNGKLFCRWGFGHCVSAWWERCWRAAGTARRSSCLSEVKPRSSKSPHNQNEELAKQSEPYNAIDIWLNIIIGEKQPV